MKTIALFYIASILSQAAPSNSATQVSDQTKQWSNSVRAYKERYQLENLFSKKVDNQGKGYDQLYGVRNFRVVLHGVFYRGGANNSFNKYQKRDNSNPLQKGGLENLCQQNFDTAIYLYKTNFSQAPVAVQCKTNPQVTDQTTSEDNQIHYLQRSALEKDQQIEILKIIYKHIVDQNPKPIYAHCWNGWHASGLISALTLMQFCGVSNQQALEYWIKNTDGNNKGYDRIKKRISQFKPLPELNITDDVQRLICPAL